MTTHGAKMLREWRKRMKLDQEEAAKKLGITRTQVSRLENNHRPGLKMAQKIERLCSIPCGAWS